MNYTKPDHGLKPTLSCKSPLSVTVNIIILPLRVTESALEVLPTQMDLLPLTQ